MKFLLFCLLYFCLFSCNQQQRNKPLSTRQPAAMAPAPLNYDSCKKQVQLVKQRYKQQWKQMQPSAKEALFTKTVTETIIPGWIGTAWSFNGVSREPQKGSIACGYFVTTVLQDAGVPLARVKLAQCASEQMITTLVQPPLIHRFSNQPMAVFMSSVQQQGYGLYIVGLDNHTGFIYNDGKDTWFIHSTFVGTRNVQKEKAANSWVLSSSKYKVLGKLSADNKILAQWIN